MPCLQLPITMSTSTTSVLNDLIKTLKDGEEGFRTAAQELKSADLKYVTQELSQQRADFAAELQSLAKSEGETDPANSSSVSGALHRGWINLKSAITSQDDHAIMAEAERGEDIAVAAFQKALEVDSSAPVRATIQRQATAVKAAHDKVKTLRDSLAANQ